MTDLLTPRRPTVSDDQPASTRPLLLGAFVAGLVAAGSVLIACMAVGLAGWFASDAGGHGDTRDALRVGADAWLLAHGSGLTLEGATVTALPLGLTVLGGYVSFRLGRWAGATCVVENRRSALGGALALTGAYAAVVVVTTLLASIEGARPHAGLGFLGGCLLAFTAGGIGIVTGSGRWPLWRADLPEFLLAVVSGAFGVVLLMLGAGAVLFVAALLWDLGAAATVFSQLHPDVPGGLLYAALTVTVAPNVALLGGSYLLGPGFAVGTGTLVSPGVVVLGPLPAVPLLAALPDEGVAPAWTTALAAVPVLAAAVGAGLMVRRRRVPSYEVGAARGLVSGVCGGVLFTGAALLSGGSLGPGRMSEVGVLPVQTLVSAVAAMGVGGLLGGLAMTWWMRRSVSA